MKEHVLSAGDRAALQGLIALAGTLGVGALLTRLMPAREESQERHLGFTVFEMSSVVAILTAAAMTAYTAILFLHGGEAITDHELARVGAPLLVSLVLLVLLVAVAKFASLPGGRLRPPRAGPTGRGADAHSRRRSTDPPMLDAKGEGLPVKCRIEGNEKGLFDVTGRGLID